MAIDLKFITEKTFEYPFAEDLIPIKRMSLPTMYSTEVTSLMLSLRTHLYGDTPLWILKLAKRIEFLLGIKLITYLEIEHIYLKNGFIKIIICPSYSSEEISNLCYKTMVAGSNKCVLCGASNPQLYKSSSQSKFYLLCAECFKVHRIL